MLTTTDTPSPKGSPESRTAAVTQSVTWRLRPRSTCCATGDCLPQPHVLLASLHGRTRISYAEWCPHWYSSPHSISASRSPFSRGRNCRWRFTATGLVKLRHLHAHHDHFQCEGPCIWNTPPEDILGRNVAARGFHEDTTDRREDIVFSVTSIWGVSRSIWGEIWASAVVCVKF